MGHAFRTAATPSARLLGLLALGALAACSDSDVPTMARATPPVTNDLTAADAAPGAGPWRLEAVLRSERCRYSEGKPGPYCRFTSIAFSPDGQWIAVGEMHNDRRSDRPGGDFLGGGVRVVDGETGEAVFARRHNPEARGYLGTRAPVAFTDNGAGVASSGATHTVRVWTIETGEERLSFEHGQAPWDLMNHPQTGAVLARWGNSVGVWDAATGERRHHFGHSATRPPPTTWRSVPTANASSWRRTAITPRSGTSSPARR